MFQTVTMKEQLAHAYKQFQTVTPNNICRLVIWCLWLLSFSYILVLCLDLLYPQHTSVRVEPFVSVQHQPQLPNATIVTAYYRIRSKHSDSEYEYWMSLALQLPVPMVIFLSQTDNTAQLIHKYRPSYLLSSLTKLVYLEKDDFYVHRTQHLKQTFQWHHETKDPERAYHTPALYAIWNEKPAFVRSAMEQNPFSTSHFFWMDIGMFRDTASIEPYMNPKTWLVPQQLQVLCNKKILIGIVSPFTHDDIISVRDKGATDVFLFSNRVSASFWGGDKASIQIYVPLYYATIQLFIKNSVFLGKDQSIINHMVIQQPSLFTLVYYGHDSWFDTPKALSITWDSSPAVPVYVPDALYYRYRCNGTRISHPKKYAVVSMLSSDDYYTMGVKVLGKSIQQHLLHREDTDMILLIMYGSLPLAVVDDVSRGGGWDVCYVPRIPPPNEERVFPRFRDQFTKLALFQWTEYERIVYLDADTLVLGDFSDLFTKWSSDHPFVVTRDWNRGQWDEGFNMGVFSVKPSEPEFDRLMGLRLSLLNYDLAMSEQGFLQTIYRDKWAEMDFKFNANIAIYLQNHQDPGFWSKRQNDIRILHFTWVKPFDPTSKHDSSNPLYVYFRLWDEVAHSLSLSL